MFINFIIFLRFYLFLKRGERREMGTEMLIYERNTGQLPLAHARTRDLACNPGMCPNQESNLRLLPSWVLLN